MQCGLRSQIFDISVTEIESVVEPDSVTEDICSAPKIKSGFYTACEDVQATHRYVVYGGDKPMREVAETFYHD